MAAVAAASIMSHGYKKNKLLPHDDDDFVLLRFAIFAFTILTTYIGIYVLLGLCYGVVYTMYR